LKHHQLLQEQHISELRHQVQMQQSTDLEASQDQIRHCKDQLREREHSLTQVRAENDVLRNELEKLQSLWDQARHNCEVQSKRTAENAAEIEKMQAKLETTTKNLKHAEEQLYKNDEIYQKQLKANEQEISKQEEQVAELQGKLEATIEMLAIKEAELASKTFRAKQAQFLEKSGRMLR
jgi:chromosome segregation ATPase